MSHWNYRLVKDAEGIYLIEAYYKTTKKGKVRLWAYAPVTRMTGDTVKDFKADIKNMLKAFDAPVLNETDLPGDKP